MSVDDIIEELPRLSPEELQEVNRRLTERLASPNRLSSERLKTWVEMVDGRLLMRANRIITQAEIQRIRDGFP